MNDLKYRILITDDDEENRVILQTLLEEHYEVLTARDGFETIEKMEYFEPDLFLLDILMPIMDGFDTCETIRRHPRFGNAIVTFISSIESKREIQKAFDTGGNYFIAKPFSADVILGDLALTFEQAPPPRSKRLTMKEVQAMEDRRFEEEKASVASGELKPRLMIVDDDNDMAVVLTESFGDGIEVVPAQDGLDAIAKIKDTEPDILLLDIGMPRMNGFDLCRSLRRTMRYKKLPIIFLSANDTPENRRLATQVGGTDFIAKPCSVDAIEDVLGEIINDSNFYVRRKKVTFEQLTASNRQMSEEQRLIAARQSVERDYGRLRDFIEKNFMKDLKN